MNRRREEKFPVSPRGGEERFGASYFQGRKVLVKTTPRHQILQVVPLPQKNVRHKRGAIVRHETKQANANTQKYTSKHVEINKCKS